MMYYGHERFLPLSIEHLIPLYYVVVFRAKGIYLDG
jgi:hypothetical protein